MQVANHFEILRVMELENIDEIWESGRNAMKGVAEEVVGFGGERRKMVQRKEVKKRKNGALLGLARREELEEEYRQKEAEVKRSVKKDKIKFTDGLLA